MSIESPQTFGEYYFKSALDQQKAFDENIEKLFSPLFANFISESPYISELPSGIKNFIQALILPTSPGFGGFALGVGVESVDEMLHTAFEPIMTMLKRKINKSSKEKWLTSSEANILYHRKKVPKDFLKEILDSEGYEDVLQDFLYKSQEPYPTIPDLITYCRYTSDPENLWGAIQNICNIDPIDFKIWELLSIQKLTTEQTLALYKRGKWPIYDTESELKRIGWTGSNVDDMIELAYQLPNAMLTVQGDLMQGMPTDGIKQDIIKCDIHPEYADKYFDAILTKPTSTDIISYMLRLDPHLSNLDTELRKIGIHPEYYNLYKELAYPIPPIADIITMAVREAFTPSIAERFGQYEDFPADFAKYANMKGLSDEWSKRYWASHWSLPSPEQGFEMLHRGIINIDDLKMLMRAQDIMPFWRDKLIQIAYRPLTRIDIRRMYQLGVISEPEVLESHKAIGYNDENAKRMTEFVIKQIRQSLSKFSSNDVINAYKNRFISDSQARELLRGIGIKPDDLNYIIDTSEHKRDWDIKSDEIKAISNLYKKGIYTEQQARTKLSGLNLPSSEIELLMQRFATSEEVEGRSLWTATQTLSFLKKKLITRERAAIEFKDLGYDTEHIDIYLRSVITT